jgi:hypothetical protein
MNLRKGHQEPFVVIVQIPNHRYGHYVRPNMVIFKYPDFKKNDLNVHVRMFNFVIKANAETSKEYIINVCSYTLKDIASYWCHNYMSKFLNCNFQSLHRHFANVIETFKMMSKYTWS